MGIVRILVKIPVVLDFIILSIKETWKQKKHTGNIFTSGRNNEGTCREVLLLLSYDQIKVTANKTFLTLQGSSPQKMYSCDRASDCGHLVTFSDCCW